MLIALPTTCCSIQAKPEVKPQGQSAGQDQRRFWRRFRSTLRRRHTDNVPIRGGRYRSNWDLSAARAIEVTLFWCPGMKPQVLAAAGFGEFDPVSANDTPEHRSKNRRIGSSQPNISDLLSLDGLDGAQPAK